VTLLGHTLFETAIGTCGIAWTEGGVAVLQLPESTPARTRARMLRRYAGDAGATAPTAAPPPEVRAAIDAMVALLQGQPVDLGFIAIDEDGIPEFHRRVYAVARAIAPGTTLTYGEVAVRLGDPGAARAVGQALGANPFAIIVPCHRVLAAGGAMGGFSAGGGARTKRRMLEIERARLGEAPDLFAAEHAIESTTR
jgi:methylated-DNA-[protein]-cysteine S-methyltransferase